jgi:hypothetical protein
LSYLEELEHKYHLAYRIEDNEKAVEKAVEIASGKILEADYRHNYQRLLNDKIDVTNWVVNFIESMS